MLNATRGDPLAGATVRAWYRDRRNQVVAVAPVKSDENGLFRLDAHERNAMLLYAEHGGQSLSSSDYYSVNRYDTTAGPGEQTIFFTDRALYRPGQTIQFKGICVAVDHQQDRYRIIKRRDVTVVLQDVNGQEVERLRLRTNDYGSLSGSFTALRDRLAGQMTIAVDGQPSGATQVNVEEYKRPKFQVTVDAPRKAARLNDQVRVSGRATAYTGAAIDGAKVRWRVVRQVRYPIWWFWRCWWMPPQPDASQEIAHGAAMTAANGTFDIEFTARPDLSVALESEPTFQFTIDADVTDTAGETRSTRRIVQVGYTALQATLTAGMGGSVRPPQDSPRSDPTTSESAWLTDKGDIEITVRTTTLDGEGQQAEGRLRVYALKQPEKVQRGPLQGPRHFPSYQPRSPQGAGQPPADPSNPHSWPLAEVVWEQTVTTDAGGNAKLSAKLPAGIYRAKLETTDRFGKPVTAELPLRVLDPDAGKLALRIPNLVAAPKWSLEPGEDFLCVWGSGYDTARAYIEIEHRQRRLQGFWTEPGATQLAVRQTIDEAMRGGFTLRVTMVRENRAYLESRRVDVPWTNKNLKVTWERFVSKLQPGQKETWTIRIAPARDERKQVQGAEPDSLPSTSKPALLAELVAALYDASLDAYLPHDWPSGFGVFRQDNPQVDAHFENQLKHLQDIFQNWRMDQKDASLTYRHYPEEIIGHLLGYGFAGGRLRRGLGVAAPQAAMAEDAMELSAANRAPGEGEARTVLSVLDRDQAKGEGSGGGMGPPTPETARPDLSQVSARKNLNETAFFFPHLIAGDDGTVRMEFTMPEALTEWKFLGFAHDADLRGGLLSDKAVTSKELMVQPNPPRFMRESDVLEFTAKVSNQSAGRQTGTVRLALADAVSGRPMDQRLGNSQTDQSFDIPAGESTSVSWKLSVPDDLGFLTYKCVGSTGRLSDGEEGYLPVLPRRVLVTESLPLPIRGRTTKTFDFARLQASGQSDSLRHQSLTVQMVSNPTWYAVMALPYLMEFPYECTEQTFNRLYANSLAQYIAGSDPKIRRVFDTWRNTPSVRSSAGEGQRRTLDSPLEQNQDLKAVMLEETPWVRQAAAESQARRNVGILLDANRLRDETARSRATGRAAV